MKKWLIPAIFGATTLVITGVILEKTPLDSIPGAQKSDKITDQTIVGNRAIGLIIENTAQAKKLADVLIASSTTRVNKDGTTYQEDILTYNNTEVRVFYAVRNKDYAKIMTDIPINFSGGIIFNDKDENLEKRLIFYLKEQGINEYEIITL